MATPHVVGAAALYLAGHPTATPAALVDALTSAATPGKISNAFGGHAEQAAFHRPVTKAGIPGRVPPRKGRWFDVTAPGHWPVTTG